MKCDLRDVYIEGMSPEQLADAVLSRVFANEEPSLPIDPFLIMRKNGIVYQFMDFKKLEGIYLVPESEEDTPFVGININRPITRQRYTAAHELCHHIKDCKNEMCGINDQRNIEKYAEKFAAALLMPDRIFTNAFHNICQKNSTDKVGLDDALMLSIQFGVSFSSCAYKLHYKYHTLDAGNQIDSVKAIRQYKPDKMKEKLGFDKEDILLLEQAVDSYKFFFGPINEQLFWLIFKNDFVFNENRIEGVKLSKEKVSEIITDLRLHGNNSVYCNETNSEIIQIAGHASVYDFLADTNELPSVGSLKKLNKMLYRYTPFPEYAGEYRTVNNYVQGAQMHTSDWVNIKEDLQELEPVFNTTIKNSSVLSVSEYVDAAAKIHHRITQIHPFQDGNGRTSRSPLNWMFKVKNLPPIYIHSKDKDHYYRALNDADISHDCKELRRVFIHELFRTTVRINSSLNGVTL